MIPGLNLQALAQFSVERMLNCALEGAGIALFAWTLLRLARKPNSGTRFAVWFTALLSVAALPLFDRTGGSLFAGQAQISLPESWAIYLFAVWAFIAAIGLTRVGVGLWKLRRLRKSSVPIAISELDESLQRTLREFKSVRTASLCVSDDLRMPTAIGFVKPLVLIPSWAMKELSATELNSILLHELAHLRRWDDCTNLAQKVLAALFFFHPAVWWIEERLSLEREMACDDLVLARTDSPKAYAECLVSLAEKGLLRRGLALAQAAISRMRHTSLRVTQILDRNRPRATRVWRPALVVLGGFAFSSMLAIPHLPRLVSFTGDEAAVQMAQPVSTDAVDFDKSNVVPVKLTTSSAATAMPPAKRAVTHPRKRRVAPTVAQPNLVQARNSLEVVVPPAVLVVMQTQQFTGPDSTVWTVCVWRVTWMSPAKRAGVLAKST
jgi:hypothetical protein